MTGNKQGIVKTSFMFLAIISRNFHIYIDSSSQVLCSWLSSLEVFRSILTVIVHKYKCSPVY